MVMIADRVERLKGFIIGMVNGKVNEIQIELAD
jgi:hypothetical protein